jgi:hypothetical protein
VDPNREPLRARNILRTSKDVYRGNFARVAGTAAVVFGTVAVIDTVLTAGAANERNPLLRASLVGAAAFLSLGSTFYAGLLDRLVGAHAFGHPEATICQVLRSLPYRRLLTADLVLTVVTAGASLFLIVPGLVVFTLFALVGPLINIEDLGVRAALRRSSQLVRRHFWLVAVLVTVPVAAEGELEAAVEVAVHGESLVLAFLVHALFGAIVGAAVGLVEVTLAYRLTDDRQEAT